MSIDDVIDLFSDRPFKMTTVHRALLARMFAVCRAAEDWAEDNDDEQYIEALTDAITDLLEYED